MTARQRGSIVLLGAAAVVWAGLRIVQRLSGKWPGELLLDVLLVAVPLALVAVACSMMLRLHRALGRRNRELSALHDASQELHGELALEAVLQKVVDHASRLLGARYGAVSVVDEQGAIREFVTAGIGPELRARLGDPPHGRGLLGVVLRDGQRLRLVDIQADPRSVGFPAGHPPMRSLLAVPITCRSPFRGNLYVADKEGSPNFSAEDEETLARFAAAAATAIDTADLHQRLRFLAVAEDRNRIAFELHDGMAQVLAYVNAKCQAAVEHLQRGRNDEAETQLLQLAAGARDLYGDVREGILALNTKLTAGRPFAETLREFVLAWRERYDVPVELSIGDDADPAPAVALQVLRIVQEALSNIRKHAHARRVEVSLTADGDGCVRVEVRDDGRGFDLAALPRKGSPRFGLLMMRERAESVGGRLEITSAVGAGTRLEVAVPLRLDFSAGTF
jgi:signal transduction histidine kinase